MGRNIIALWKWRDWGQSRLHLRSSKLWSRGCLNPDLMKFIKINRNFSK